MRGDYWGLLRRPGIDLTDLRVTSEDGIVRAVFVMSGGQNTVGRRHWLLESVPREFLFVSVFALREILPRTGAM